MKKKGYSMAPGIKKLGAGNLHSFHVQGPNVQVPLNNSVKLNVNCIIRGIPAQHT